MWDSEELFFPVYVVYLSNKHRHYRYVISNNGMYLKPAEP